MTPTNPTRKSLAKKFYQKFAQIPDEKWCEGLRHNYIGQSCALGHTQPNEWQDTDETKALITVFGFQDNGMTVANVNNGHDAKYPQNHTKLRILAALDDIIKGRV